MFQVFWEEKWISLALLIAIIGSIVFRIIIWILYRNMIKETDNMSATSNRALKQCKLKFANCYQLNGGVANVPVFVDKFISRLAFGPVSFGTLYHLSGQLILLSALFAGIGICKSIVAGRDLGDILPFYIVCFGGLYLYFSVSNLLDVKSQRRELKISLVDYLENHMISKLVGVERDLAVVRGDIPSGAKVPATEGLLIPGETKVVFSKAEERELEELLRDFLKNA